MVDALILETVEPTDYVSTASGPSDKVTRKAIQRSFRPWVPQKFISVSQVGAWATLKNFSHYRRGDAMYVVIDDEWYIYIRMYGRVWRRPAIRVQVPSLDVQALAPIGHCVCEHCGNVDVSGKYAIIACSGNSYRICKKHLKSGELDYVKSKYKVEVIHDNVAH